MLFLWLPIVCAVCSRICCLAVLNSVSVLSQNSLLVVFVLDVSPFDLLCFIYITTKPVQVNMKRRGHGPMSTASSVYSAYSDSGVGGDWANSGLVTPIHDHTQAYVAGQTMLYQQLPARQKEAQAAAIALISNSPQPDMLNPHVRRPMHHHHHHHQGGSNDRQRRNQFVRNYPGAYSSDDSSSCFTMTSQSSTSEALFIPRKHQQSVYTESDEPQHFTPHQR